MQVETEKQLRLHADALEMQLFLIRATLELRSAMLLLTFFKNTLHLLEQRYIAVRQINHYVVSGIF